LTAHETKRARALDSGFDLHLQKPVAIARAGSGRCELMGSRAWAYAH
jgi:hypothetical protein